MTPEARADDALTNCKHERSPCRKCFVSAITVAMLEAMAVERKACAEIARTFGAKDIEKLIKARRVL